MFKCPITIWWSWAILKVECKACQSSLISRQGQLLYLIASIAKSFYLLTQFMSSHGPYLLLAISWIFWSKNKCFVLLTILLNCRRPIIFKVSVTVSVQPTLGMFGDVDNLWVLSLYSFYGVGKRLNSMFKGFAIWDTICVDCSDGFD